jgi:hypothetical protein
MMTTVAIVSTFIGALLGMRFKVFILFPATLLSGALNIGVFTAQGSGLWNTLLATVLSITGLQLGFFVNCVVPRIGLQAVQLKGDITTVEGIAGQQDGELEAAFNQLDGAVAELMALSTAKQSAATAAEDWPATAAAGSGG